MLLCSGFLEAAQHGGDGADLRYQVMIGGSAALWGNTIFIIDDELWVHGLGWN